MATRRHEWSATQDGEHDHGVVQCQYEVRLAYRQLDTGELGRGGEQEYRPPRDGDDAGGDERGSVAQRPEDDDDAAKEHEGDVKPQPHGLAEYPAVPAGSSLGASSIRQQDRPSRTRKALAVVLGPSGPETRFFLSIYRPAPGRP